MNNYEHIYDILKYLIDNSLKLKFNSFFSIKY